MKASLAACREAAWSYHRLPEVLYVFFFFFFFFFFSTWKAYLLIHAPYTRIVVFDISVICRHRFCRVKFVIIPSCFYSSNFSETLLQPSVVCYNVWAYLRCSICSPLGENIVKMGYFHRYFHCRGWRFHNEFLSQLKRPYRWELLYWASFNR